MPVDTLGPLAVTPQQPPFRSRKAGFWLCPWIRESAIIDTAALSPDDQRYAGLDTFPENCVLVVINNETAERIRQDAAKLPFPLGPSVLAGVFIDGHCRRDPALSGQLQWRT